jgi:hypothetical protein
VYCAAGASPCSAFSGLGLDASAHLHGQLLEAILERVHVDVLRLALGGPVQGDLQASGHVGQLFQPVLGRVRLLGPQQLDDLVDHVDAVLAVLAAVPGRAPDLLLLLQDLLVALLLLQPAQLALLLGQVSVGAGRRRAGGRSPLAPLSDRPEPFEVRGRDRFESHGVMVYCCILTWRPVSSDDRVRHLSASTCVPFYL